MGYLVYKHTSPSGKVYIGITSKTASRRWNNGRGYLGSVFYHAIRKYGWNNIKHEILYENLTQQEAVSIEHDLILQCNEAVNMCCRGLSKTCGGLHWRYVEEVT